MIHQIYLRCTRQSVHVSDCQILETTFPVHLGHCAAGGPNATAAHQNWLRAQQRGQIRLQAAAARVDHLQPGAHVRGERVFRGPEQSVSGRGESASLRAQSFSGVRWPCRAVQESLRCHGKAGIDGLFCGYVCALAAAQNVHR